MAMRVWNAGLDGARSGQIGPSRVAPMLVLGPQCLFQRRTGLSSDGSAQAKAAPTSAQKPSSDGTKDFKGPSSGECHPPGLIPSIGRDSLPAGSLKAMMQACSRRSQWILKIAKFWVK